MPKKPFKRPYKFEDPSIRLRLLEAIKKGAPLKHCCAYAGVSYITFRYWIIRGEKQAEDVAQNDAFKTDHYYAFYEEVEAAKTSAAMRWLDKIETASDAQWQAAAWLLERRYPEDYGRDRDVNQRLDEQENAINDLRHKVDKNRLVEKCKPPLN